MSIFYSVNTTEAFLVSILFGIALRMYFDLFRLIRRIKKHNYITTFFEDLIYTLSSCIFIFIFVYVVSGGVFRLLEFIGMITGCVAYHYTLSNLMMKVCFFIFSKIRQFFLLLYKNTVIRVYIYLDKFYKKGKIVIEKERKEKFNKKLSVIFLKLNERNDQSEQSAPPT